MQNLFNFLKNLFKLKRISYQLKLNDKGECLGVDGYFLKNKLSRIKTKVLLGVLNNSLQIKRTQIKKIILKLERVEYDIFNFPFLRYKKNFLLNKNLISEKNYIGQILNSYILLNINDNLFIVDKHALHERVILDYLNNNDDVNKSRACRGAVRFNEKTEVCKLKYLLNRFSRLKNPFICAHGRPTILFIKSY